MFLEGTRAARVKHPCNHEVRFRAGEDPLAKVKRCDHGLDHQVDESYCNAETSKATQREDRDADVARHSSELEAAAARSTKLDGEISPFQRQLQMNTMRAHGRNNFATANADLVQGIS